MEPKAEAGGEMSVVRDRCRLNWKEKSFSATTQVVNSTEPPGADPHARWCGMGGGSPSPLSRLLTIIHLRPNNILRHLIHILTIINPDRCENAY